MLIDDVIFAGLRFIGHNSSFVTDDKCDTPAGFNVIFPGMLERGVGMGLEIPLAHTDVDAILRLRDTELNRFCSSHRRCAACWIRFLVLNRV